MTDHSELENSVAAYVLGAAEPEELESLRAHLEGCSSCRDLAVRLRRAVAAVPLAVEEARPPARLRDRVLAAAAASRTEPVPTRARPRALPRIARPRRFSWPRLRVPSYAAVGALAVAVLALGAWNVALTRGLQEQRETMARFSMSGSGAMSGASADVLALQRENLVLVDFRGMPPLQPGKVYEVWLGDKGGHMVRATVFVPDADGAKVLVLTRDLNAYNVIAVTVENGPRGTSAPTQQPQLQGRLT